MIYALYHVVTDTPMDKNGYTWLDVIGGIVDALVLFGLLTLLVTGASGVAEAQSTTTTPLNETAPYYDNQTSTGNQTDWFPDGANVTLDTLGKMGTRLGPYIIGTGEQIPGGNAYAGTIITGLVMVGVFVAATAFTAVGATGGIVIASTTGYGLVSLGLAPGWLKLVLLMIIGVLAARAGLGITR